MSESSLPVSQPRLLQFLRSAKQATYADPMAGKAAALRPSSSDYHFEQDDLAYHDTYFGARDFIGEEIVYLASRPVWGLNYYGWLLEDSMAASDVYGFLRQALMQVAAEALPVRGPNEFVLADWRYVNRVEGTLTRFSGDESIHKQGRAVYRCLYHGGAIA